MRSIALALALILVCCGNHNKKKSPSQGGHEGGEILFEGKEYCSAQCDARNVCTFKKLRFKAGNKAEFQEGGDDILNDSAYSYRLEGSELVLALSDSKSLRFEIKKNHESLVDQASGATFDLLVRNICPQGQNNSNSSLFINGIELKPRGESAKSFEDAKAIYLKELGANAPAGTKVELLKEKALIPVAPGGWVWVYLLKASVASSSIAVDDSFNLYTILWPPD